MLPDGSFGMYMTQLAELCGVPKNHVSRKLGGEVALALKPQGFSFSRLAVEGNNSKVSVISNVRLKTPIITSAATKNKNGGGLQCT